MVVDLRRIGGDVGDLQHQMLERQEAEIAFRKFQEENSSAGSISKKAINAAKDAWTDIYEDDWKRDEDYEEAPEDYGDGQGDEEMKEGSTNRDESHTSNKRQIDVLDVLHWQCVKSSNIAVSQVK